jgi:glutathione synthase
MRIAVQMDPIEKINIRGDTSFALMLEAQARGHEISTFHPEAVTFVNGKLFASIQKVKVTDLQGDHFLVLEKGRKALETFDVILVRQDPPFNMAYLSNTYLLDSLPKSVMVINRASGIRDIPEKLSLVHFPDLIPPTLIGRDSEEITAFAKEHEYVVLKPLFLSGGDSVFKTRHDDDNFPRYLELLLRSGPEPIIVQQYLQDVMNGDKRVMMLDGQVVGAVGRVPKSGDFRANIHVGGRPKKVSLSKRDMQICERIGPYLREHGIVFAGLDIIDRYLIEVNVTSPTLVRELLAIGGPDVAALFWDRIEKLKNCPNE